MTITGGSGLGKDEIDRMVKEAEAHEAEDKKRKEDAETRNQPNPSPIRPRSSSTTIKTSSPTMCQGSHR